MTDPTNKPEDMLKKLSRRNWLRNAAIAATSAVALPSLLTGCTKEQWNHLKNTPHPGGGLGNEPSVWYHLQVNYTDKDGNARQGYLGPVDPSSDPNWWATRNWAEMLVGGTFRSKFKLHPRSDGWDEWEIDDGYYLSVHGYGEKFFFRDDYYPEDPINGDINVGWSIINGKLYNNYYVNKPAGCEYWSFGDTVPGYYVGCDLNNDNVFTCELVPA